MLSLQTVAGSPPTETGNQGGWPTVLCHCLSDGLERSYQLLPGFRKQPMGLTNMPSQNHWKSGLSKV